MLVFINYKQNANPDHDLAVKTEVFLRNEGYEVFRDESRLRGGENWSREILDNLTKAKCVLCFVSNASMKSRWVINEIEEALNLNKPLIPVKIEELDGELNFTMYRPRFLGIQYIHYNGDFELLSRDILASLKKMKLEHRLRHIVPYRKIVSAALAKYDFDSPVDIICWFLEFLQDFHIVIAAGAELNPIYRVPKWISSGSPESCRSVSEALIDAVNQYASMYRHNFEIGKKGLREHNWWWEERLKCSDCFAEILNKVMSEWQPHVERVKKDMIARKQDKQNK
jgi:hypothetical protein